MTKDQNGKRRSSGQALVEIIIIALVIVFSSIAIAQIISASIKGVSQTRLRTAAVFLAQEEAEILRAVAKEDWHNITDLATSSANLYHATTTGGKWVTVSGSENVRLNNATYTRSFYILDVYRSTSTSDIASSGGYYDPSTSKAVINVNWSDSGSSAQNFMQTSYLSRFLNRTYDQTDWSGGAIGESVVTAATTTFATSSSIDPTGVGGSLQLITE